MSTTVNALDGAIRVESAVDNDNVNVSIYRGKTIDFEIIYGGATPIDVTGWSASMQIRTVSSNALLLEMSTSNSKATIGTTDGKIVFAGTPAESTLINQLCRYEVELTKATGEVVRAIAGTMSPITDVVT